MATESRKDEQKTHLNIVTADREFWEAATNDPVMIRKLQSIGAVPTKFKGDVCFFKLGFDQVLLRKGKRKVSDAQRSRFKKNAMPIKNNADSE